VELSFEKSKQNYLKFPLTLPLSPCLPAGIGEREGMSQLIKIMEVF